MFTQADEDLIRQLFSYLANLALIDVLLLIITLIIVTWVIGRIIKSIVRYIKWIPSDARNGIILLINLFQLLIITMGSFTILGADQDFIIGFSALITAVIGFASISVAANIVGGLYLIITRPFKVGDLIKTQGAEGIVEEIGLNFTKIVQLDRTKVIIPNSRILNASLLNYNTIGKEESESDDKKGDDRELSIAYLMWGLYPDPPRVRYRSMVQLQFNIPYALLTLEHVKKSLDEVCEQYTTIFGYKPQYYFGRHDFRQNVFLLITTANSYTVFNTWPYLMESIIESVYSDLQLEEKI